jgi:hypothetical protein
MDTVAALPPHRLTCQLIWRERLLSDQPGWQTISVCSGVIVAISASFWDCEARIAAYQ